MIKPELLDRTPPHSLPAERSVIGACILIPEQLPNVAAEVSPADFYVEFHRRVLACLLDMDGAGVRIDETILMERMGERGWRDDDAQAQLVECLDACATPATAVDLAKHVRGLAAIRKAIHGACTILQRCYETGSPAAIIASVEQQLAALASGIATSRRQERSTTLEAACLEYLDAIEAAAASGAPMFYRTGLRDLDEGLMGGLVKGEFMSIGGRPSEGKTALATQILDNLAEQGCKTMFVSEEMVSAMLGQRTLTRLTPLPAADWVEHADKVRSTVASHFQSKPPIIVTRPMRHTRLVVSEIERVHRTAGLDFVAVDYVQLMKGDGEDEVRRIANSVGELKSLCGRLGIGVLALSQVERQTAKLPDPAINRLALFKGTGAWDEASDVAIGVWWPWQVTKEHDPKSDYRVHFLKNRNRGINTPIIGLNFESERQVFKDRPRGRECRDVNDFDDMV